MLLRITQHPKAIAWFFLVLFYMDWVLAPLPALAGRIDHVHDKRAAIPLWHPGAANGLAVVKTKLPRTVPHSPLQRPAPVEEPFSGGPTQPEMQAFSSVNSSNMVDLFSGDFSYNIP